MFPACKQQNFVSLSSSPLYFVSGPSWITLRCLAEGDGCNNIRHFQRHFEHEANNDLLALTLSLSGHRRSCRCAGYRSEWRRPRFCRRCSSSPDSFRPPPRAPSKVKCHGDLWSITLHSFLFGRGRKTLPLNSGLDSKGNLCKINADLEFFGSLSSKYEVPPRHG